MGKQAGRFSKHSAAIALIAAAAALIWVIRVTAFDAAPPIVNGGLAQGRADVIDRRPIGDFGLNLADVTKPAAGEDKPAQEIPPRYAGVEEQANARPKSRLPPLPSTIGGESEDLLREWNVGYHRTRQQLREEQAALGAGPLREHTFYTTDCTLHSLWQSLGLEHSWAHVNNVHGGGFLSRIVSGCATKKHRQPDLARHIIPLASNNEARRKQAALDKQVTCDVTVDDGCFGIYYVPAYHHLPSGEFYAPFNRPNGIWYWLNHTDLTEDVFILLDPDMIYLSRLYGSGAVRPGVPAAQYYGYMDFEKLGQYRCPLCPTPGSFDRRDYAVGPPWMIAVDDLRKIMSTWVLLVPMLRAIDPGSWIVEMIAYSVACAYHKLPHVHLQRGMVDNIEQAWTWDGVYLAGHAYPEGSIERRIFEDGVAAEADSMPELRKWWKTASSVSYAIRMNSSTDAADPWWERVNKVIPPYDRDADEKKMPVSLLHYCYTWEVGEEPPAGHTQGLAQHDRIRGKEKSKLAPVVDYFHWSKYRTPSDWPGGKAKYARNIMSCDAPLLQEFHTPWALPKNGASNRVKNSWMRTSHMLHLGLPAINEALREYKLKYCAPSTRNHHELIRTSHPAFWVSGYDITDWRRAIPADPNQMPLSMVREFSAADKAAQGEPSAK